MKLTKSQLKQIIREELAHDANDDILFLERDIGPSVLPAFKAVRDLYEEATTNEAKEKIEGDIIHVFNNMIQSWRDERGMSPEEEYSPEDLKKAEKRRRAALKPPPDLGPGI